jgi:DNA-binding response OmpR family regulator
MPKHDCNICVIECAASDFNVSIREVMPGKTILVLDGDEPRRRLKAFGLRCSGFSVDEVATASSARSRIAQHYPHLVLIIAALLDIGIQDFVRAHRRNSYSQEIPVLTLVEREGRFNAATALEWGIDDYLLEPIAPQDFIDRIRAGIDCRSSAALLTESLAGLRLDSESGLLRRGKRSIALSPTEQRLLEFLLARSEQVIPRDLLTSWMWGSRANLSSRMLDVSVCRLRRSLKKLGCESLLQTVSRRGYRLSACAQLSSRQQDQQPELLQ